MNLIRRSALSALLALSLCSAWAGPLDERAADAHLKAIATGDVDALMQGYGDDPLVDWVGGPLDGRYRGRDAVREMWKKFAAANDNLPRSLQHGAITQNANPKGATVTTLAEYAGAKSGSVRVRHVFIYRDGRLVTELWQIDPSATVTPVN
jgi:ketosteroid isomerase-like protein